MLSREDTRFLPLLIPALLFYGVFLVYPMMSTFFYCLTNYSGLSNNISFVGLKNFATLVRDGGFRIAISNTLIFVVMDIVIQNALGLTAALILDMNLKTTNMLRTVFFVPVVIAPIVISFIWTYIYNYDVGIANLILSRVGLPRIDFIGNPGSAIYFVILSGIWQWFSYRMVIYLAGLQTIPRELYEAAVTDGANSLYRFFHITIPMLVPAFTINIILCTIGALKQFDLVFMMTGGGPGYSTEVMTTKIYREAFTQQNMGYATAIGLFLFLAILLVTVAQYSLLRRREVEA